MFGAMISLLVKCNLLHCFLSLMIWLFWVTFLRHFFRKHQTNQKMDIHVWVGSQWGNRFHEVVLDVLLLAGTASVESFEDATSICF